MGRASRVGPGCSRGARLVAYQGACRTAGILLLRGREHVSASSRLEQSCLGKVLTRLPGRAAQQTPQLHQSGTPGCRPSLHPGVHYPERQSTLPCFRPFPSAGACSVPSLPVTL